MKRILIMFSMILLFCSCGRNEEMKIDIDDDQNYEEQRSDLADQFIRAYCDKNIVRMKPLVSSRFTLKDEEIHIKSDDPSVINATQNIMGENLDYKLDSIIEKGDVFYYTYQLSEMVPTGKLDNFSIRIGVRNIDGYWVIDDYFVILGELF